MVNVCLIRHLPVATPGNISNNVPGNENSLGRDTTLNMIVNPCDMIKRASRCLEDSEESLPLHEKLVDRILVQACMNFMTAAKTHPHRTSEKRVWRYKSFIPSARFSPENGCPGLPVDPQSSGRPDLATFSDLL